MSKTNEAIKHFKISTAKFAEFYEILQKTLTLNFILVDCFDGVAVSQ
ncbi:hypothetical protein OFO12_07510 [Campylobacter sp. JMF_04 NA10]|nr:hypothetical protein [Campylobacter sp. JMF_04 NA10]